MLRERRSERGGALVEFAVVAPLMIIFLFGIVEFGMLLFSYHATDYAAKFGARYISVRGSSCQDSSCPMSSSSLQTYLKNAVPGLSSSATVVAHWASPDPSTYTGISPQITCDDATHHQPGCFVTVQVSNPVNINIPFVQNGTFTLTSQSTQIVSQ